MHKISNFVFWITLVLYVITLFTVSYVGVYLVYIAIPIIVISGLIMKLTKPKHKKSPSELAKATSEIFNEVSTGLNKMNTSLDKFNKKAELIDERTNHLKEQKVLLQHQKIEPNIEIKYAKSNEDRANHEKIINEINHQISAIDVQIDEIKKQCELEIEKQHM